MPFQHDQAILDSVLAMLLVDEITPLQSAQIRAPIRSGGLGLHALEELREIAYTASIALCGSVLSAIPYLQNSGALDHRDSDTSTGSMWWDTAREAWNHAIEASEDSIPPLSDFFLEAF